MNSKPPIESNLFSVDIRQRLKIAKAMRPTQESLNPPTYSKNDEVLQKASLKQRQDEKKRYMEMESESYVFASVFYMDPLAQRRDVIIALLRKQREERIKKEMISLQNKPRRSKPTERLSLKTPGEILDQNIVDVQELK
ncbi:UPF0722 protein C11orf88 homolog isoform X1 [Electrophorus electricus]|uniref:UPF0722 protein C11orf88 homolog isoform X1 n=1 Tax=Electrophorus electricus TaxID=8005 RepID=UPI000F0A2680|nr:UPF0722 protein C11orf88 homolog isoform X1 [Electrophorus electricus]